MTRWPALAACATCLAANSASITVRAMDAAGAPLEDAVAWVVRKDGAPAIGTRPVAAVEQVNKSFVPLVSIVQVGTMVRFPNRDETRHHVYSFSPAKRFEIKLYAGTPAAPIEFDKAGEVVLGCNIHDNMVGYIYVVDSPWFARAGKDGRMRIDNVPAGDFEVHVRHYLELAEVPSSAVKLAGEASTATVDVSVGLKARPKRPGGV